MRNKFILSVIIPVIILAAMTIQPLLTLYYGQDIKLKTQPVDPTDLFRGDYVILDYEISNLKVSQCPELDQIKDKLGDYEVQEEYRDKQVYVSLKEEDGVYLIDRASFKKPDAGIYLSGKMSYFFEEQPPEPARPAEPANDPNNNRDPNNADNPNNAGEPNNTANPDGAGGSGELSKPVKDKKYLPDTVKVIYQLDKYFVPENTGLELEEFSRKGQVIATVKVYQGYAQVVNVEKDPEEK